MAASVASPLTTSHSGREEIPDEDSLYRRIHFSRIKSGKIRPSAFDLHEGEVGLSVDWARYCTPEDTLQRARKPRENAVGTWLCGEVRALPGQVVRHDPQPDNYAHTLIVGEKTAEVRLQLARLCRILLPAAVLEP